MTVNDLRAALGEVATAMSKAKRERLVERKTRDLATIGRQLAELSAEVGRLPEGRARAQLQKSISRKAHRLQGAKSGIPRHVFDEGEARRRIGSVFGDNEPG